MTTEVDNNIFKNVHTRARVLLGGQEFASMHKDFGFISSTMQTNTHVLMLTLLNVLGHQ